MGRFLLGFAIGAAIGAAAVVLTSPRAGATRAGVRGLLADQGQGLRGLLGDTLDVARQASGTREQELWADFRNRLEQKRS